MDKEISAQNGIQDPDHIPPTMTKFFDHPAVQKKMGSSGDKKVEMAAAGGDGAPKANDMV